MGVKSGPGRNRYIARLHLVPSITSNIGSIKLVVVDYHHNHILFILTYLKRSAIQGSTPGFLAQNLQAALYKKQCNLGSSLPGPSSRGPRNR